MTLSTSPPDPTTHPPAEPGPYFAPLNPHGPLGTYFADRNRHFWLAIRRVLPSPDDDVDVAYAMLARALGVTRLRAEKLYLGVGIIAQHWKQTVAQRVEQLAAQRNLTPLPEPEEASVDD